MASEAATAGLRRARLEPSAAARDPASRARRGKEARAAVPRSSHAGFQPAAAGPTRSPCWSSRRGDACQRVLPIRYGRVLASPFAFFRGAALLMAGDLAPTPVTGLTVQACGDAHLSNFGIFASPERRLVFDINDFDETLPGPWEWDLKRLAASAEVAVRGNGFGRKTRRAIVLAVVARYRREMRALAAGVQALDKLTREADGRPRFAVDPPLLVPVANLAGTQETAGLEGHLNGIIANYRRTLEWDRRFLIGKYQVADMARKVVGVGSVGMRCFIVVLTGRDPADRLYLQVKEAVPSVLSEFVGASPYPSQGERVVAGQWLMQAASDVFLGWHRTRSGPARDYHVRQLRDWKFSLMVEDMDLAAMHVYAQLCGQTLARAHGRSGDRIAIGAYLGSSDVFDRAVADFAADYADQNERDHARAGRRLARAGG